MNCLTAAYGPAKIYVITKILSSQFVLKIAIASGKGGTGKTTLAIGLFNLLSDQKHETTLIDCDVEEPNAGLFLESDLLYTQTINVKIPHVDESKCIYCGKCAKFCEFNAIFFVKPLRQIEVFSDLCHSCGACSYACRNIGAITEKEYKVGIQSVFKTNNNNTFIEGKMDIGRHMAVPVIKEVLNNNNNTNDLVLIDAPPGTSCPVIETIKDVDFIIIVAEPTPFGASDLKLMMETVEQVNKPYGVVINKSGLGNEDIYRVISDKNVEILMEIPFKTEYAKTYARGISFIETDDLLIYKANHMLQKILKKDA